MNSFLSKFQRSTNSTNFIPEIDGLRFYAIITVVIFHLNTAYSRQIGLNDLGIALMGGRYNIQDWAWWIIRLDMGVKVFFAISGFVLALPFVKYYFNQGTKINLPKYFFRRLTRLEPPFVISLIFFTLVHIFILNESFLYLLPHFSWGLLYSHVIVFGYPSPINPVTWSLETEAQFYLLAPFLFALIFIRRNAPIVNSLVVAGLFGGSILARYFFIEYKIAWMQTTILAFLSNFLTGVTFCMLFLKSKPFFSKTHLRWDILGLFSLFVLFYFYKPQHDILNNLIFNAGIFGLMFSSFKGTGFNWFFTRPLIYIIGGMCYSIYLLHYAFFHLIVKYTAHLETGINYKFDLLLQAIVIIPLMLIISGFFFLIIEKPCMNPSWPQRLRNKIKAQIKKF